MENLEGNSSDEAVTINANEMVTSELQPLSLNSNGTRPIATTVITAVTTINTTTNLPITNENITCSQSNSKLLLDVPSTSAAAAAAAGTPTAEIATDSGTNSKDSIDHTSTTSTTTVATNTKTATTTTATTLECPICLQTCIHPAQLPCGHIFCFLCVKGVAYKNKRCAMCRREIPTEFLNHPQLVNGIEDIFSTRTTEDGYQWFYEGRNGGWWAYDKRSALEIEAAYQIFLQKQEQQHCTLDNMDIIDCEAYTYDLLLCGNMYTIDFLNRVQYPQDRPYKERKICRSKNISHKGVAGIWKRGKQRSKPY